MVSKGWDVSSRSICPVPNFNHLNGIKRKEPKGGVIMNVCGIINNQMMELLQQVTVPWSKPWNEENNMLKNLVTRKDYRNKFVSAIVYALQHPYWMTFKQAQDKGGHVIKGSKSTSVIFWKFDSPFAFCVDVLKIGDKIPLYYSRI